MAEDAIDLCRRALAACRALAERYDDAERLLAAAGGATSAADLGALSSRLADAERALFPLLEPLARLRGEPRIAGEARALLDAIDAIAPDLARRHAAVLCAARTARDACAERLVGIARARATRAEYGPPDAALRLSRRVA